MASVFLSYDREDAARARPIAAALEKSGHSVWWDRHIKGGAQYSDEIDKALKRADAVVVLWSERSVKSAWVRDEAAAGRDSGRLVPVRLDHSDAPLGFRQYQAVDFNGGKSHRRTNISDLNEAIHALTSTDKALDARKPAAVAERRRWRPGFAAVIALLALVALMFGAWRLVDGGASVPVVAVVAADGSTATQGLARDLLVKLGSLRSAKTNSMRLTEDAESRGAGLLFKVGATGQSNQPTASLALLEGKDRSLIWSKDFQQPSGQLADLQQQVAFTAARVLGCALDGLAPGGDRLRPETLKLYLNACAKASEVANGDTRGVAAVFLEVIRDAPRFKPAWANLLLAEWPWDEPTRNRMRQHIAAARKLDPTMPEATLAEISLLPAGSFARAMMLIDRARDLSPQNPDVLFSRASWLAEVGRLLESVDDARRAAALDPLSPATRNGYIATLTDAGQFDAAREELQRAEQLWPGTDMILHAHYLFHFRAGDPKEALRIAKSGGYRLGHTLFLEARINPTEENFQRLKAWFDGRKAGGGGDISFITQAYGVLGRDDDVFREYMTWPDRQAVSESARTLFRPWVRGLRQQPRFMQVAKRVGVLDYWRLSGKWPDFCNEPGLPYDCKKEAAKLLS